jgi:hypothetical protein
VFPLLSEADRVAIIRIVNKRFQFIGCLFSVTCTAVNHLLFMAILLQTQSSYNTMDSSKLDQVDASIILEIHKPSNSPSTLLVTNLKVFAQIRFAQ